MDLGYIQLMPKRQLKNFVGRPIFWKLVRIDHVLKLGITIYNRDDATCIGMQRYRV